MQPSQQRLLVVTVDLSLPTFLRGLALRHSPILVLAMVLELVDYYFEDSDLKPGDAYAVHSMVWKTTKRRRLRGKQHVEPRMLRSYEFPRGRHKFYKRRAQRIARRKHNRLLSAYSIDNIYVVVLPWPMVCSYSPNV
jgi:hypothetical protein